MTVKELIDRLQQMPPDAVLVVWDGEYMQYHTLHGIGLKDVGVRYNGDYRTEEYPVWEDFDPESDRFAKSFQGVDLWTFER